ncbi:MAG: acyl-CoA/acyl-ACP dehydrogenase [Bacteroidia bacterium]|nr:acyl-CoA/acyl-ACP dehydrogenase [Bacteroidia bacterium]
MDFYTLKMRLQADGTLEKARNLAAKIRKQAPVHWENRTFDRANWDELVACGLLKAMAPAPWGEATSWAEAILILEEIALQCGEAGFALALTSQLWTLRGLAIHGSEAQQKKWIPRLMQGEIAATAIAEDHSGSELGLSQTRLLKQADGNFLLNGSKSHTSLSFEASLILVPAFTTPLPETGGLAIALLEAGKPGLSYGKRWQKMGFRTLPTQDINFSDISLQPGEIIFQGKVLGEIMTYGRILFGMLGAGLARFCVNEMTTWAQLRKQNERPIGDHQFIQERIVNSLLEAETARSMALEAMHSLENKEKERFMRASLAKLAGAKAFRLAAENGVAVLGSRGYEEGPLSRAQRDSLGLLSAGGTEEFHKDAVWGFLKRNS